MRVCPRCGSSVAEAEARCQACGTSSPDRPRALKIGADRAEDVPQRSTTPEPGEWGRTDDDDAEDGSTVVTLSSARQRTPSSGGGLAAALALDRAPAGEPAEVVPLRPSERPPDADAVERAAAEQQKVPPSKPPVLASRALRKEMAPGSPASRTMRWSAALLGCLGALGMLLLVGRHGPGVPVAGAFTAVLMLGLAPMPYPARAAGVATVAAAGLLVSAQPQFATAPLAETVILMVGVLVLSVALLFRSWHRASYLARALVALGLSLSAGWLWMSQGLEGITILETQWQAWMPRVLHLLLALTLMLSLLAFMDARSTGGCGAWAALVLSWYTAHAWVELAGRVWPPGAPPPRFDGTLAPSLVYAAAPLFMAVLAFGLAQLLAVVASDDD